VLTSAAAIRTERIHWLWKERIPRRALVIVAGEKGLGKSTLTNGYLVARLTRGELEGEFLGRPIDIAVANAEDDWRSVVKPRLMAHGADLDHVHRLDLADEDGGSLLTLPDDVSHVERAFAELQATTGRAIGMLVIDPLTAFLSRATDSHKDASVRRALFPLADLAERLDLAVVVVAHLNKDDHAPVLSRVSGSVAFANAARAVLAFARDPDDPDGEQGSGRVLVMAATNWGRAAPSLAARIETTAVQTDEGPTEQPLLVIESECETSVSDQQRGAPDAGHDDVADAVLVALKDGPRPASEVKGEVSTNLRVSRRTVERAATRLERERQLVRSKDGFPAVATWALATPLDASAVATEKSPANTRDSTSDDTSSDRGRRRVANGNGHARHSDQHTSAPSAERMAADLTDAELVALFPGSAFDSEEPTAPHDPLCPHPAKHAGRSWRTQAGRLVCGVCHPPATPDLVARLAA
jgi:hypothetical protein